jgi:pyruvate formate lyase activating enzyme
MDIVSQNFVSKYYNFLPGGKMQCTVCPNQCKLDDGQRGICFVRMRQNDKIVLTTYGKTSGIHVDPVEKKPLHHFLPGTSILSFGTIGCNLSCQFCQNWHISKSCDMNLLSIEASPESVAQRAKKLGCKSVAFTYNEPITFMEYAIDTAVECHKLGIKTVAVTNGYILPGAREEFFSYMDAANVDLKAFTEDFYHKITKSKLQPILDTLIYLARNTNVWLEITSLLIPGLNDSPEEIDAETKWLADKVGVDVPLHFSAFFPAYHMLDTPSTGVDSLLKSRDIARKNGLRYVYVGNVVSDEGGNTYCYNCGTCLIARQNYVVNNLNLDDTGKCKKCGTACAGRW